LQYLEGHPWFEVEALGASSRSAGKKFSDATTWQLSADLPGFVKDKVVTGCSPADMPKVDFVFSALDADVAGEIEANFRDAGIPVFSNAKNYRMISDVPLVVPPVNGDHLDLVKMQKSYQKNGGFIVTNANCSTTGMVIALKPLYDAFGIDSVFVTTLQAISGAGYPGLPSSDILDNIIPYISGEEEKLQIEYQKILGKYALSSNEIAYEKFPLSASVNRVHVRDGHSMSLSIKLKKNVSVQEIESVLANYKPAIRELSSLPSAPAAFIQVRAEPNRPQPRLDRDTGRGYTTIVGRVRPDPINTVKMQVLSHNTVMGAAGSSILNAELAAVKGLLHHKS
jgi:aspartate-semialdehyde dehydrogenase